MAYSFYAAHSFVLRPATGTWLAVTVAAGALASAVPAEAGQAVPPGAIIISRDVPLRPAQIPKDPGEVVAVQTAPTAVILDATGRIGTPLSDGEAAAVSASPSPTGQLPSDGTSAFGGETLTATGFGASSPGQTAAAGNVIGSSIASGLGAIGTGISALNSALHSIGRGGPNQ
jgi:hypothetical protein